jgi:TonB family protein
MLTSSLYRGTKNGADRADIISAMKQKASQCVGFLLLSSVLCAAQVAKSGPPEDFVVARHTFFDFGPPFDYYEIIRVKSANNGVSIERALVTPPGMACTQPDPKVEYETATVTKSMTDLLDGKNLCLIPERDLHRELKRCKKCLAFSGVNITMLASCGGKDRLLHMDIMDRDLFDARPNTPENTSWTMHLLSELDKTLGPGAMEKPIFPLGDSAKLEIPDRDLIRSIREGQFDELFGKEQRISQLVIDAGKPPLLPPSVEIVSITPFAPISAELPKYPPIAKAARVEGLVTLTFDVNADGKVQNIVPMDGPKMIQLGAEDAISKWSFPQSSWGKSGQVSIRFKLNCKNGPS